MTGEERKEKQGKRAKQSGNDEKASDKTPWRRKRKY